MPTPLKSMSQMCFHKNGYVGSDGNIHCDKCYPPKEGTGEAMSKPMSKITSRAMFDLHRAAWIRSRLSRAGHDIDINVVNDLLIVAWDRGRKQGYAMAKKGIKP